MNAVRRGNNQECSFKVKKIPMDALKRSFITLQILNIYLGQDLHDKMGKMVKSKRIESFTGNHQGYDRLNSVKYLSINVARIENKLDLRQIKLDHFRRNY